MSDKLNAAREAWREWTAEPFDWDKDFTPDWQAAQQHTEEIAHDFINALEARIDKLEAELRRAFYATLHDGPQWEPSGWLDEVLRREDGGVS